MHQTSFWGAQNIVHENNGCVALLSKGTNWKFTFPWWEINWYVVQTGKTNFRYTIWIMCSEKSIIRWTFSFVVHAWGSKIPNKANKKLCTRMSNSFCPRLPSCGLVLVVFIVMNTYTLTESRSLETLWEFVGFLVTKKILNMELNMTSIVLMKIAYTRHS